MKRLPLIVRLVIYAPVGFILYAAGEEGVSNKVGNAVIDWVLAKGFIFLALAAMIILGCVFAFALLQRVCS